MKINYLTTLTWIMYLCEGCGLIVSFFLPWVGNYSINDLIRFSAQIQNNFLYFFPIIAGILLILTVIIDHVYYLKLNKKNHMLFIIGVILVFNIEIYFYTIIFNDHGRSIWQNAGFIVNLVSLGCILLTISISFFDFSSKNQEKEIIILDKINNQDFS